MYYPSTVLAYAIVLLIVTFWLLSFYENQLKPDNAVWSYQNELLQVIQGELAPISYNKLDRLDSILVVGISSVIGSHLASKLSAEGKRIVGVDVIFDGYHEGRLKIARLENLLKDNALLTVLQGDACTYSLMEDLWARYNFTQVFFLPRKLRTISFCNCLSLYKELLHLDLSSPIESKLPFFYSSSLLREKAKCTADNTSATNFNRASLDYFRITPPSKILGAWQNYDWRGDYGMVSGDEAYIGDVVCGLSHASQLLFSSQPLEVTPTSHNYATDRVITFVASPQAPLFSTPIFSRWSTLYNHCDIRKTSAGDDRSAVQVLMQSAMGQGALEQRAWMGQYEGEKMPCECHCLLPAFSLPANLSSAPSTTPIVESPKMCHATFWAEAMHLSVNFTSSCSMVLYTVLLGEAVNTIHSVPSAWRTETHCNVAFVSSQSPLGKRIGRSGQTSRDQGGGGWTYVLVNDVVSAPLSLSTDTRRLSRLPKIAPDFFFSSQVQYAVYLDAKLSMRAEPNYIAQLMAEQRPLNSEKNVSNPVIYPSQTVLLMVQHPVTEDTEHDAYLVLQNRGRPNITRYRSLLRKQVRWYSSVAQVLGGVNQTFCLRHTFEGAFLVHDLHVGRKSESEVGKSSKGKWMAHQVRCMWLREYLKWSDRDQGAGAFAIGAAVHHTLYMLPAAHRETYLSQIACNKRSKKSVAGDFLPVHFDFARQLTFDVRILPAQHYLWRKSDKLAKFQRLKWQE